MSLRTKIHYELLVDVKCPYCGKNQNKQLKNWKYGSVEVTRCQCICGKSFNRYKSPKKTWTIPKQK